MTAEMSFNGLILVSFFVLVNYNNPNLKWLVLHAVHSFTILLEIVRFLVFTAVCSPSRSYFYHSVTHGK